MGYLVNVKMYALISWCSGHQGWVDNRVPLTLPATASVSQECRTLGPGMTP